MLLVPIGMPSPPQHFTFEQKGFAWLVGFCRLIGQSLDFPAEAAANKPIVFAARMREDAGCVLAGIFNEHIGTHIAAKYIELKIGC